MGPDQERRYLERIPLERFGHARDIAGTALFLASNDAAYLTGSIVNVDGGFDAAGLIFSYTELTTVKSDVPRPLQERLSRCVSKGCEAFVTGAAGGIGARLVAALAERGARRIHAADLGRSAREGGVSGRRGCRAARPRRDRRSGRPAWLQSSARASRWWSTMPPSSPGKA